MKITLFLYEKLVEFFLPAQVAGSYSFDADPNEDSKLINVEERNGVWTLYSTLDVGILVDNTPTSEYVLNGEKFVILVRSGTKYLVYISPTQERELRTYSYIPQTKLIIGNTPDSNIRTTCSLLDGVITRIEYQGTQIVILTNSNNFLYVNNKKVESGYIIRIGDKVQILNLKIQFLKNVLIINNPEMNVEINNVSANILPYQIPNEKLENREIREVELYSKKDFFSKSPRIRRTIEEKEYKLDNAPDNDKDKDNIPLIITLGPMLSMGVTSAMTLLNTIIQINNGTETLKTQWISIVSGVVMLLTSLFWPLLTSAYNKHLEKKKRIHLYRKYGDYLVTKREELEKERNLQIDIIKENRLSLDECIKIISMKGNGLWDKRKDQDDFLQIRVGIGSEPFKVKIEYPESGFTLDQTELRKVTDNLVAEYKMLDNVPIGYSLFDNYMTALTGNYEKSLSFVDNVLLQLMTFYCYDELKIMIFTDEEHKDHWKYVKFSNYCFDDNKNIRYFAGSQEESKELSDALVNELNYRTQIEGNSIKNVNPYYIVICENYSLLKKMNFFKTLTDSDRNLGYSIIFLDSNLGSLPSKCSNFINLSDGTSGILKNSYESQEVINFKDEVNKNIDMMEITRILSNIPVEIAGASSQLPNAIAFLEMEKIGKVEQLNVINRWNTNDSVQSLKAEIGVDEDGNYLYLDIHEKFHGPHGLVAGMTGSGKSEFIITYILSLAMNYSPDDVAFILIDYKGGGLAGAFENKQTGVKLPHLAGTITNLDKAEMSRTLVSIDSEVKKRQAMFNTARDALGESTIDIYKYQKFYHEGKLKEPIPHLLIISDEFAELKAQQPEFMDNLISVARIGRSLGVHLILATQKPSGVVDDQIWSNTKFRVCLKVQDASDSNEMLKRPDAASLKQTGRFFLQVGYDEYFALGQSAWTGAPYYEADVRKKRVDNSIAFVNYIGSPTKIVDDGKNNAVGVLKGEELPNIMKYIVEMAKKENVHVKQLWLNALPPIIYIDGLKEKYEYTKQDCNINPVIGEYDAPDSQKQGLLTLPITTEGNWIIYGMADSGKEELMNSIVYSCITTYSPKELNMYLLDFGAETMKVYKKAPHVGDVVLQNDVDKVMNLWKLIADVINERKKKFADFGGDYISYSKATGEVLPNIVVMINGFELYNENYGDATFDTLVTLTRDCMKYGVYFIISSTTSNGIRSRLAQYLPNHIVLQMNDKYDYSSLLSRTKLEPSPISGRGLVKLDAVYEFQSAVPTEKENLNTFLLEKIKDLQTKYSKDTAKKIPVLPEVITISDLSSDMMGLDGVPVGIEKETLAVRKLEVSKYFAHMITGMEFNDIKLFGGLFIKELSNILNKQCYVFDMEKAYKEYASFVSYYDTNILSCFKQFGKFVFDMYDKYKNAGFDPESISEYGEYVCVIVGLDKFKNVLGDEFNGAFGGLLSMVKAMPKVHFIFIDSVDNFKKNEFDGWYKDSLSSTRGIWIGNGIANQYTLKSTLPTRILSAKVEKNFGYFVDGNTTVLIKVPSEVGEEEDYETL